MTSRKEKINRIINDPLRKNMFRIVGELIFESLKERRFTQEYFSRLCYRKNYPSLSNYCRDKDIGELQMSRILHSDESAQTLINKVSFYHFCIKHDLPTPKVIAFSKNNHVYTVDGSELILTIGNFDEIFQNWIVNSKHHSIFIKPVDAKGGVGAYRIDLNNINDEVYIHQAYHSIISSNYIIQETIEQHESIAKINPSSINTIRIDTYKPSNESSRVLSAFMRFGRKGSVVDNPGTSSGFFISLDLKTHRLKAPGLQLTVVGNNTYTHHPDTQVQLDNYYIPYVDQVIKLVERASDLLEDRLVGWDICVGEEGPIIIEGNHNYHVVMQEIAYGGYRNHPEFIKVLKEEGIY